MKRLIAAAAATTVLSMIPAPAAFAGGGDDGGNRTRCKSKSTGIVITVSANVCPAGFRVISPG
jgi:hypothetical protein